MAKPWSEVEQSQGYQSLAPQQQMAAKQEYFMSVVAPKPEYQSLTPQQQSAAQQEFFGGMTTLPTTSTFGTSTLRPIGMTRNGTPIYDPIQKAQAIANMSAQNKNSAASQKAEDTAYMSVNKDASNLNLIGSELRNLMETYAGALKEGGAGNQLNARWGKAAAEGWMGPAGNKYPNTGSYEGAKADLLTRIQPMLTQQYGKDGSVRIMQGVWEKTSKGLPELSTPPQVAMGQAARQIKTFYRMIKGAQDYAERTGLTAAKVDKMSPKELDNLASKVVNMGTIKISPEEEKTLNELTGYITEPVKNYMGGGSLADRAAAILAKRKAGK
jgi:hypothetical protein